MRRSIRLSWKFEQRKSVGIEEIDAFDWSSNRLADIFIQANGNPSSSIMNTWIGSQIGAPSKRIGEFLTSMKALKIRTFFKISFTHNRKKLNSAYLTSEISCKLEISLS